MLLTLTLPLLPLSTRTSILHLCVSGYIGMMLAREETGVETIRRVGPLGILKAVSFPKP
jgi:ATP adenylyltransferase/5',5'''-P-1,P-4-tetraphosphate phosphorylase II